jgi:hypothetical protein
MKIRGRVHNGTVILEGAPLLPEGMEVTVSYPGAPNRHRPRKRKRVKLPLVQSKHPGTLHLTNERIAETLQEDDVREYSKFFLKHKKKSS